ncbi:MAG: helix-turn-helix domain-containing protein [Pseudohongiellaceae bacterium]
MAKFKEKKINAQTYNTYRKLEDVVGCKWSVSVLLAIGEGVNRPGALERKIDGISTKVLTERLRKLTAYGLLEKHSFAEVPPRTEYSLTASGKKLINIIEQIQHLDSKLDTQVHD